MIKDSIEKDNGNEAEYDPSPQESHYEVIAADERNDSLFPRMGNGWRKDGPVRRQGPEPIKDSFPYSFNLAVRVLGQPQGDGSSDWSRWLLRR